MSEKISAILEGYDLQMKNRAMLNPLEEDRKKMMNVWKKLKK